MSKIEAKPCYEYEEALSDCVTKGGPAFEPFRAKPAETNALRSIAYENDRNARNAIDAMTRAQVTLGERIERIRTEHGPCGSLLSVGQGIAEASEAIGACNATAHAFRALLVSSFGQETAQAFYEALAAGPEYFAPAVETTEDRLLRALSLFRNGATFGALLESSPLRGSKASDVAIVLEALEKAGKVETRGSAGDRYFCV